MAKKVACLLLCGSTLVGFAFAQTERRLSVDDYRDRMKGGWIGQIAGVSWGAPTEFRFCDKVVPEAEVPKWTPEMINQAFGQDDLYVEMTFLRTLEQYGLDVSIRQAGVDFANSEYQLWCANNAGRSNLRRGIAPPDSSHPKFNKCPNDIDYQIEADFAGLISPGMPNSVIALGEKFGRLMNYGDGVYGGQFMGGMYAEAFFESDVHKLIAAGLACIPAESQYAEMVRDTVKWHAENPGDWEAAWRLCQKKYREDPAYQKASNGGIDVKINGAYVLLGLLYGNGDIDKTIVTALRGGQDSDCNPSSAGGVVCASLGFSKLPERFTKELKLEPKFSYTAYSVPGLMDVCEKLARQVVVQQGGRMEKGADGAEYFVIPAKPPKPSALQLSWAPGPIANAKFTDEEYAQIRFKPHPADVGGDDPTRRVQGALDVLFPGWKTTANGKDMEPGYRAEYLDRQHVVMTHPLNKDEGVTLSKEIAVPKDGAPKLTVTVANHEKGDFTFIARVNGQEVLKQKVGGEKPAWQTLMIDLSPCRGKAVTVELVNQPDGWFCEAAYWGEIAVCGGGFDKPVQVVPDKVPCAVEDRQACQVPDRVQLSGWMGSRVAVNELNRLVRIDTDRLLEGYRKRPGRQSWDGEHVGKWLHAATLAWVNTGDSALRRKLDDTVVALCACQLDDGYLGTYLDANRWTEWDIWAHKYNLLGLITYMRYTGNLAPLPTCCRMADLLCKTFGDGPGQRDIIPCGEHMGMAPTSVLEPMALLYRLTSEPRYLAFCQYILRAWEQSNGPHIVSRLLTLKRVDKVGNAKAYEMLSCLNGALELYRTTGDRTLLEACLNAWQDIVDHRLYITGAASYGEHFHDDYDLPNRNNVGETCVTVTWLQFNAQLLRLTGEARFAEQLEHVALNQLFGAQKPDGTAWGYYVQMEGVKPYSATLDGHCCLSSGPRGVALLPTFAVTTDADGVVVNLFDAGVARVTLSDGTPVAVRTETRYPADGLIRVTAELKEPKAFALKLRVPAWCAEWDIEPKSDKIGPDGYVTVHRTWQAGDAVALRLKLAPRLIMGDHLNQGKAALCYGPLVLAADEALMAGSGLSYNAAALAASDLSALNAIPEPAPESRRTWAGAQVLRVNASNRRGSVQTRIALVPFADAGATGAKYKVWVPLPGKTSANVLLDGTESRSRVGNRSESINDDNRLTFAVTFDGQPAAEDWFGATLDAPTEIRRIVFAHGKNFHDGGWFVGNPQAQIQREGSDAWETVGAFGDYPDTTSTGSKNLAQGQLFTLALPQPVRVRAVRVIGKPACGDNANQAFASCGELQAFAE